MSDRGKVSFRGFHSAERGGLRRGGFRRRFGVAVLAACLLAGARSAAAQTEAERIRQLEQQVEELRQQVEALKAAKPAASEGTTPQATTPASAPDAAELARRLDLLAQEIEQLRLGESAATAERPERGFGPAASKVYRQPQGLSIGGYGEVLYQKFDDRRDDGTASRTTDEIDMLRSVVYVGYKFDDRWLFNSELEFEHGGDETGIEFAYLDYLWRPELGVRFGHLLLPMGFLNELHEPTVFLGANRPLTERVIIPSTWHENGAGIFGDLGPVSYRSYLVNGFDATGFTAGGLRDGRQGGAEAKAEDFAWVTRLESTPVEGLRLAGSAYLGKAGQGLQADGRNVGVSTHIYEAHAEWRGRGFELRALAARADLGDVVRLNSALELTGNSSVGEELRGHYLQAGYDVLSQHGDGQMKLVPFVRWEQLNTQHRVPQGFTANPANDREVLTYGLSWMPRPQLVIKADFQDFDNDAGSGVDQFNLGVGYVF